MGVNNQLFLYMGFIYSNSMQDYQLSQVVKTAPINDGILDPVTYKYKKIVTCIPLSEKDIKTIKRQKVKHSLLFKEITGFIPLVSLSVFIQKQNIYILYILAIGQIILGLNDFNIMIVLLTFVVFSVVSTNVNYIFHIYLCGIFLYLMIHYLSFKDIEQSHLEFLGVVASIVMFVNYFYFQADSVLVPIIFSLISLLYIPTAIMRDDKIRTDHYLYNTYNVYATL